MKRICVYLLTAVLMLSAGSVSAQFESVGSINFVTSGSAEAQQHFLRGVAILHSFGFKQAREEFQAAQKIEPEFAMAYWGEALSYNHPLFVTQDIESPRKALARLATTRTQRVAMAPTEKERGFLVAVETLFGEGSYTERAVGYMQQMQSLYERFPEESEVAAYYALSMLSASNATQDKSQRLNVRAGAIALKLFQDNRNHPGAAHYTIHAFDNPVHAPLALDAAYRFSEIAPAVSHARHMPTHIFIQHGMWDRVSMNNQSAYDVSRELWKPGDSIGDGVHSLDWGQYGDLQRGDYAKAKEWINVLQTISEESGNSAMGVRTISRLKARHVVETEKWKVAPVTNGLPPHELLAIGLSASRTGNQNILKQVETELASAAENSNRGGNPMARGLGGNYTKISSLQVSALVKVYEGQAEAALALLDEAEEILLSMRPPNGPASPIKPLHELYGEILLELGQPGDAIEKFNTSLRRLPNRPRSLLGLARGYAKTGDYANARTQYAKLAEVWSGRDDFVEMQEARRFLETTDDQ